MNSVSAMRNLSTFHRGQPSGSGRTQVAKGVSTQPLAINRSTPRNGDLPRNSDLGHSDSFLSKFFDGLAWLVELPLSWLRSPRVAWAGRKVGWVVLKLRFRVENRLLVPIYFAVWRRTRKERFLTRPRPPAIGIASLGLEPQQLILLKARARAQPRFEIGEFDQDGFLFSEYGPIRSLPCVSSTNFVRRNRTSVKLMLLHGAVVVEKDFRGHKVPFIRELSALRRLNAAGCRVPAILDLDFKRCCLTMPLLKGKVLREELVKAGAVLHDRIVAVHPDYRGLSPEARRLKRIEAGRKVLSLVVTEAFVGKLYRTLQHIHAAGVAPMDFKYGNIIVEESSGEPRLIDFESAQPLVPCCKFLFNLLCDYNTEQFNLHFGTKHLTPSKARDRSKQRAQLLRSPASTV